MNILYYLLSLNVSALTDFIRAHHIHQCRIEPIPSVQSSKKGSQKALKRNKSAN